MLTPRVTERHRLSPYAFAYEGKPGIPANKTLDEHRAETRAARPRKRKLGWH